MTRDLDCLSTVFLELVLLDLCYFYFWGLYCIVFWICVWKIQGLNGIKEIWSFIHFWPTGSILFNFIFSYVFLNGSNGHFPVMAIYFVVWIYLQFCEYFGHIHLLMSVVVKFRSSSNIKVCQCQFFSVKF